MVSAEEMLYVWSGTIAWLTHIWESCCPFDSSYGVFIGTTAKRLAEKTRQRRPLAACQGDLLHKYFQY